MVRAARTALPVVPGFRIVRCARSEQRRLLRPRPNERVLRKLLLLVNELLCARLDLDRDTGHVRSGSDVNEIDPTWSYMIRHQQASSLQLHVEQAAVVIVNMTGGWLLGVTLEVRQLDCLDRPGAEPSRATVASVLLCTSATRRDDAVGCTAQRKLLIAGLVLLLDGASGDLCNVGMLEERILQRIVHMLPPRAQFRMRLNYLQTSSQSFPIVPPTPCFSHPDHALKTRSMPPAISPAVLLFPYYSFGVYNTLT
ncbi:hypothetical protein PHSY_002684 [Pseudozyma hubeiensis SY62]|uniref:Uncharacterized protein n=1 Tax=Pseudozyma hubeiensis (strain SY62) TaxID=1305764 RepID=R9P1N6_PSEHS|nr:hypothetical protein PHSY_002684 [Pseudozyma hubeiensis SY62]GAC95109.1 hypothetical protein PHSY_002684 [Pseudozyma hubeiensis SY62]